MKRRRIQNLSCRRFIDLLYENGHLPRQERFMGSRLWCFWPRSFKYALNVEQMVNYLDKEVRERRA